MQLMQSSAWQCLVPTCRFLLPGAQDLSRFFGVLPLASAWCFQGQRRSLEEQAVEILSFGDEPDHSYAFCVRTRQPGLCKERCSKAYPALPLEELLEPRSLTFGGSWVQAELPAWISPATLGWPDDFWDKPWDACQTAEGLLAHTARRYARIPRRRRQAVPDVPLDAQHTHTCSRKCSSNLAVDESQCKDPGLRCFFLSEVSAPRE